MRRNVKHGESARWQVPFVTRREKVGSTGKRCHRFELWEVAWNNCGERGGFSQVEAINPQDNDRLPLQDRGRDGGSEPIYGIPAAPWSVADGSAYDINKGPKH